MRTGLGLVVGRRVARYLGTQQFGRSSHALAFVGLSGSARAVYRTLRPS